MMCERFLFTSTKVFTLNVFILILSSLQETLDVWVFACVLFAGCCTPRLSMSGCSPACCLQGVVRHGSRRLGVRLRAVCRVSYATALDVWVFACVLFVLAAFLEYLYVSGLTQRRRRHRTSDVDVAQKRSVLSQRSEASGKVKRFPASPVGAR